MSGVVLTGYDPDWPRAFSREATAITSCIGGGVVLHHIGSTAVPGMAAKPIIDILGVVAEPYALDVSCLLQRGYVDRGAHGIPGRRFLVRGPADARSHHLHLHATDAREISRHLAFRDRLRASPEDAAAYAALKRAAAREALDRAAYTEMKTAIILEILARADARNPLKHR